MKKFLLFTALMVFGILPAMAMAQTQVPMPPGVQGAPQVGFMPGKWWKMPELVEKMNLTPDELAKMDQYFLDFRTKSIELNATMEKARVYIDSLFDMPTLDEKAINEKFKEFSEARAAKDIEQLQFLLKVRKLLGQDRLQNLRNFFFGYGFPGQDVPPAQPAQ